MVVFMPRVWGDVFSSRDGFCVSEEYTPEAVRRYLVQGERIFLVCADSLALCSKWMFASDHLALFGTGALAGENRDDLGERFPNLRGMYTVPDMPGESVKSGVVMGVPSLAFSTGAELAAFPCDAIVSTGLDLCITAAHGGAKVVFALRCGTPDGSGTKDFSFLNRVVQEIEGGEE